MPGSKVSGLCLAGGVRAALLGLWISSALAPAPALSQPAQAAGRADPAAQDVAPAPLGELLATARSLLARGAPREAYDLLAPQTRWYGGSPEFDFLLGVAAIDAGRPGQAVLALERVLAVAPDHLQARAELARALLAIRETEAARREFEAVAAQRIPPEVRSIVDGYLARIATAERAARPSFHGRAEIGTGWDSNATLGSLGSQWLLGGGTEVIPLPSSRPRSTALINWGAGLEWQGPIDGGWRWTAGAQAMGRTNASAHTLDQTYFDLTGGLRYQTGCHGFDMLAQLQHLRVDRSDFRNAAGALGQWRCDLDARTQVGAYLQHFAFDFPDQPVRDARRDIGGLTFARALPGSTGALLVGSAYTGHERPNEDVPQLEYRFHGLRAVLSSGIAPRVRGWAALSWEARNFAAPEPLFDAVRQDRETEYELGAAITVNRSWVITPRLIYTRNASTLPPNDFRRTQALVSAQYRF
ncbi:MAG TPA: tetratricopeptide repeat protein [Quisquiliibacterium sp.]|nr:tetratricopeptide repeat protein [Quisquiliibacterium sp.]